VDKPVNDERRPDQQPPPNPRLAFEQIVHADTYDPQPRSGNEKSVDQKNDKKPFTRDDLFDTIQEVNIDWEHNRLVILVNRIDDELLKIANGCWRRRSAPIVRGRVRWKNQQRRDTGNIPGRKQADSLIRRWRKH
jgi:hypothetical protein